MLKPLSFLLCSVLMLQAYSQPADKLPTDKQVVVGKLDNGLTYYIRQNAKPEDKIELRLVVNAGSVLEDDDQQGLAHMAEHMAFNGTKNFKKNDIISYLQSIGVGFGNDLNAYTSFDETVYILPIPTTDRKNIEQGFQILEDWAHQVSYLTEDINSERNVILEESRLGKGANDRMGKKLLPSLLSGSKYAVRLPIGLDSLIANFNPDVIRRFYRDWYRPDLMAVIVVGTIEPGEAEAMIKKHFAHIKNPTSARPRKSESIPPYTSPKSLVVTDKEATAYSVEIHYSPFPQVEEGTAAEYRANIVENLFTSMLNERMEELTQKENPPFLYGFAYFQNYARGTNQFNAVAGCDESGATRALAALATEIERAKRFGFLPAELERAKKNMLAGMERSFNERKKTESSQYADEYIRNFLTNEPIPGIEKEFDMYKQFLPGISVEEVNRIAKSIEQHDDNLLVTLMGPDPKPGVTLPAEASLLTTVAKASASPDIARYQEAAVASSLLSQVPKPGKITGETTNKAMGTTIWTLSNGASVEWKKTAYKDDQIIMGARRPGGIDLYTGDDKYNATYASAVVGAMGYGAFAPTDLQKAMSGKVAGVSPTITGQYEGWSGSSSVKDLESMMQMLYLQVTQPRVDTALFNSFIQKNKAQLAFLSANPQIAFVDSFYNVLFNSDPRRQVAVPKAEYYEKVKMERALDIYRKHMGDVGNMRFVFVGSIDEAKLRTMVETYIASLPGNSKIKPYAYNGLKPVSGNKEMRFYKGTEPKSLVIAYFNGPTKYSTEKALATAAVSEVLNIRIIEELREKIQGIYTGGTNGALQNMPYEGYNFVLQLPCGPEKVDTLLLAMNQEIADLKKNGPKPADLEKVKKQWMEQRKDALQQNGVWSSQLLGAYFPGTGSNEAFLNYEKRVEALTAKQVQDAANEVLNDKNKLVAVLMPEKK